MPAEVASGAIFPIHTRWPCRSISSSTLSTTEKRLAGGWTGVLPATLDEAEKWGRMGWREEKMK